MLGSEAIFGQFQTLRGLRRVVKNAPLLARNQRFGIAPLSNSSPV